ncbi:MAG TPA: HDOD domain-containing protein, partial [Methylophaga sp.]|nr:HDOD domain-containing protein [Methylophaga sp.]
LHEAEQRIIGFDHAEVGAILIENWRLPDSLVQVARYHHQPAKADHDQMEIAIVHVADVMVSSVPFGHNGDQHVPPLDEQAWQSLGLKPEAMPPLLFNVHRQLDNLATLMRHQH